MEKCLGTYYDPVTIIELVKERPCIWNQKIDAYRDKYERTKAWEEIFTLLNDDYSSMTGDDKRLFELHVHKRWSNLRDNFIRTLRSTQKKYVHARRMKFLLDGRLSKDDDYFQYNVEYLEDDDENIYPDEDVASCSSSNKKRKKDHVYSIIKFKEETSENNEPNIEHMLGAEEIDFVDMNESHNDNKCLNEDEAFFQSLLPTVAKYDEDDKLEFRLGVLNLMKEIRMKNKM